MKYAVLHYRNTVKREGHKRSEMKTAVGGQSRDEERFTSGSCGSWERPSLATLLRLTTHGLAWRSRGLWPTRWRE